MTRLPQEEIAFYYAEMMQLPPDRRQIFVDNVVQTLDAIAPRCAAFAARGPRRWTLSNGRCHAGPAATARDSRRSPRWHSQSRKSGDGSRWRDTATCRPDLGTF